MPCYKPLPAWVGAGGTILISPREAYCDLKPMYQIPCGQCIGCRLDKARMWATRIMQESQMHDVSTFLTLTYDDKNLPPAHGRPGGTIVKWHLRNFWKRLRKYTYPQKFRYYACGEYGDKNERAHYHAILFGYWPKDSTFLKVSKSSHNLYKSDKLDEIWGKGLCVHGMVSFESAEYVASYTVPKILGRMSWTKYLHHQPEFSVMSRRPGIGESWYNRYKDETWRDGMVVARGREMRAPRYYREKLKLEDPDRFRELRHKARMESDYGQLSELRLEEKERVARHNFELFNGVL